MQERVAVGTTAPRAAHGDGLGSLRLVTGAAGTPVSSATYEPWGAPRSASQALGGFGFTGEQTDAETGFVYLRARHYDPATGRFLQEDSYQGRLAEPATQHRYAYVHNNPPRYTDPSGHGIGVPIAVLLEWALAGAGISISAAVVAEFVAIGAAGALLICVARDDCRGWLGAQVQQGWSSVCAVAADLHRQLALGFATGMQPQGSYAAQTSGTPPPGFTQHGWDQASGRDGGRGVSDAAIEDARANPIQVKTQQGGKTVYVGKDAVIVVNAGGNIVTTWAKSRNGWRNQPSSEGQDEE